MKPITIIPTKIPIKTLKSQGNISILVCFCWYNGVAHYQLLDYFTDNMLMDKASIVYGNISYGISSPWRQNYFKM